MELRIIARREYRLEPVTAPIRLGWTYAEWVRGWREVATL